MKRTLTKTLATLLAIGLLTAAAGCTGAQTTAPSSTAQASTTGTTTGAGTDSTALSGTLNVALAADIAPDSVTQWVELFKKDYPGVTVNVTLQDASDYAVLLEPLIAAGNMPDVVGIATSDWFGSLADKGYLRDVSHTPGWEKQLEFLQKMYTSRGGVGYGVANGVETEFLYYNVDHFKQAGIENPPANWEEFLDCCQKLKDAGFQPLAVAGAGPNNMGHSFVSFGIAYEIVNSGYDPDWNTKALDGEYDFGTAEWSRILDKTVVLRDAGYFARGYESADLYECLRQMTAGETSMSFQGSFQAGNLFVDGGANLSCTTIPWNDKGVDQVGITIAADGYGLGKNSRGNEALADVFYNYVTYEKADVYQNLSGTIPPWKDAAADMPNAKVDERVQAAWDANNALKVQSGEPAQTFSAIVYEQVKQFVQAVALGSATPDQMGEYVNPAQKEYVATLK